MQALQEAGAPLDDPAILGGVLYATLLLIASGEWRHGNGTRPARSGRRRESPGREGLTMHTMGDTRPIAWRWCDCSSAANADPERVDRYGMTALQYAASVDYGDSSVLDLLVKHGARRDSKTKEGLTALDRARAFRHTRFYQTLGSPRRQINRTRRNRGIPPATASVLYSVRRHFMWFKSTLPASLLLGSFALAQQSPMPPPRDPSLNNRCR